MVDPIIFDDAMTRVNHLLENTEVDAAAAYLTDLHPADSAEILSNLDEEDQQAMLSRLDVEKLADIFEQLDEEEMVELAQSLQVGALVDVLDQMEPDMAADLLGELGDAEAAVLLEEMEESDQVAPLLTYAEDSAGGIMNSVGPMLRRTMTVAEALDFLRAHYTTDSEDLYYLYVVDRHGRLVGLVSLRSLILARPEQTVEEIFDPGVISVRVSADQEEVAQVLARYDLLAIPVVDDAEHLLGVVTVDDVVDVLEEEATEDIYRLAQVSGQAEIFSPIPKAVRDRLPWLVINLGTALLASSVVSLFEETIARAALLAVFMPIVAGMGGNSGTQTMTVVVRSLALGELELRHFWKLLGHEIAIGLLKGLTIGLMIGLIAWLWKGNPMLGVVIGLAMVGNLLVAALAGVVVPFTLRLLRLDPALGASVFVTTVTDVVGFAVFLGLGTYFLAWLV